MKTRIALLGFMLLGLALEAPSAKAWWAEARVYTDATVVTAEAYNGLPGPIVCSGRVYGQTYYGAVANAYLANTVVPPGLSVYVYVYTNPANPFVSGWAEIWCE